MIVDKAILKYLMKMLGLTTANKVATEELAESNATVADTSALPASFRTKYDFIEFELPNDFTTKLPTIAQFSVLSGKIDAIATAIALLPSTTVTTSISNAIAALPTTTITTSISNAIAALPTTSLINGLPISVLNNLVSAGPLAFKTWIENDAINKEDLMKFIFGLIKFSLSTLRITVLKEGEV